MSSSNVPLVISDERSTLLDPFHGQILAIPYQELTSLEFGVDLLRSKGKNFNRYSPTEFNAISLQESQDELSKEYLNDVDVLVPSDKRNVFPRFVRSANSISYGEIDNLALNAVAASLTDITNVGNTGNVYVDSVLWGGWRWSNPVITYSFWHGSSDTYSELVDHSYNWLDYEIAAVEAALQTWANVANISFVRAADNTDATLDLFSVTSDQIDGYVGICLPPDPNFSSISGGAFLAWDWGPGGSWSFGLNPGGGSFGIIIHELGHGLGLAHPHDEGGGSPTFPGVTPDDNSDMGNNNLNQTIWTIMSYNDGWNQRNYLLPSQDVPDEALNPYGLPATPMAIDIAAIQHLYGANWNYRTGYDRYTLPTQNGTGTSYSCIWDAGGIDTLSASGTSADARIDLRDAPLIGPNAGGYVSYINGIAGGFTIANGVTIENALGGYGNDILIGNEAGNVLIGGGGYDVVIGGAGNDIFRFLGDFSTAPNHLNVQDFTRGADRIALDPNLLPSITFQGYVRPEQLQIGSSATTIGQRLIYNPDTGHLFYDSDGIGIAGQVHIANISPGLDINHLDILAYQDGEVRGFKADQYLASNEDLIAAFGYNLEAAKQHYLQYGVAEGRSLDSFDEILYLGAYIDLADAFGADLAAATQHYINHGFWEGRDYITGLPTDQYLASHLDLIRAFGYNLEAANQHYLGWGYQECRAIDIFDEARYLASYGDLIETYGYNLVSATQHYISYGASEGRATNLFDANAYLNNYQDLQAAFGSDLNKATQHFIEYGYFEGRTWL